MKYLFSPWWLLLALLPVTELSAQSSVSLAWMRGTAHFSGFSAGYERHSPVSHTYTALTGAQALVLWRDYQTSVGATVSCGLRRTARWGLFLDYRLRAGYIADHYGVDFYRFADNTVSKIAWQHSALLGGAAGLGYDFSRKTRLKCEVYTRLYLFGKMTPSENPFTQAENYGIETGIAYHLH
jgi:hypothetical protein